MLCMYRVSAFFRIRFQYYRKAKCSVACRLSLIFASTAYRILYGLSREKARAADATTDCLLISLLFADILRPHV